MDEGHCIVFVANSKVIELVFAYYAVIAGGFGDGYLDIALKGKTLGTAGPLSV